MPKPSYTTPEEAVGCITSGDRVFIHSVAAAPRHLIDAMVANPDHRMELERAAIDRFKKLS